MGKYTTKQIKNALDKLDEGWALDRQALLFDNALEPIYRIEDEDGNGYTQIHLMWLPVYERKGSHFCSYNVATGEYQIEANANARAVATALEQRGINVTFNYPLDGAIRTEGSRY